MPQVHEIQRLVVVGLDQEELRLEGKEGQELEVSPNKPLRTSQKCRGTRRIP